MLDKYHDNDAARQRIWDTHCKWSGQYPRFCEQENFEVVMKADVRRLSVVRRLQPRLATGCSKWLIL